MMNFVSGGLKLSEHYSWNQGGINSLKNVPWTVRDMISALDLLNFNQFEKDLPTKPPSTKTVLSQVSPLTEPVQFFSGHVFRVSGIRMGVA